MYDHTTIGINNMRYQFYNPKLRSYSRICKYDCCFPQNHWGCWYYKEWTISSKSLIFLIGSLKVFINYNIVFTWKSYNSGNDTWQSDTWHVTGESGDCLCRGWCPFISFYMRKIHFIYLQEIWGCNENTKFLRSE